MTNSKQLAISVVMCAYTEERWDSIVRALEGLQLQTMAPLDVILSIDHNPQLAERCRNELLPRFPDLRIAPADLGPRGIGGARNNGIQNSEGEVVAFLDDDAYPERCWLEEIAAPFQDSRVGIVAGNIVPRWIGARRAPSWMPPEYLWVVGATWRGFGGKDADIRNPIGASMAIRRSLLVELGGFNTDIKYCNDETDLSMRLSKMHPDLRIVFAPESIVTHEVSPMRQTVRYFFRRCWTEGMEKGRTSERHGRGTLMRELDYCFRYLTTGVLGSLVTLRLGRAACLIGGFATTLLAWLYSRSIEFRQAAR